jgi:hypothetical protein
MSNSKLLKEAIADAKAVRETAIANAKIALEEAFTPRLQSILSQKLQQEMEDEEEADVNEEYGAEDTSDADSSGIDGDNKQPADDANSSSEIAQGNPDTEVETAPVGSEEEETEVVKEGEEEGDDESIEEGEYNADGEEEVVAEEEEVEESWSEESEEDEDELDLESIIRELEADLGEELDDEEEGEVEDIAQDVVDGHEEELHNEEESEEEHGEEEVEETYHEGDESEEDLDEEIDLNEILREMGYGDLEESEEEDEEESVEENNELDEVKAELEAAISTISELKSTINEVNLLNAKLLYTNKLFRSYELTNEQKMKVVETLDRTGNVREVKLVFSTLAESFKFTGTTKKQKQTKLTESFASKPVASTAPSKEVIQESTNTMADRFKKLANIK